MDNAWVAFEMAPLSMSKKITPVDYESMIQKALRQVVRDILQDVAHHGLQGDQHFYFTFATNHPWVDLPAYLKEQYPSEMVLVLQNEFEDLEVRSDSFSVTLFFEDNDGEEHEERLTIPFLALINFADPSQNFGLQFVDFKDELGDSEGEESDESKGATSVERSESSGNMEASSRPNVISLDDFRKK